MRIAVALLALLLLNACAISPGRSLSCNFKRYELSVADPFARDQRSATGPTLAQAMRDALLPTNRSADGPDTSMLFLSGGSLNGAFGAGYLDEWRRRNVAAGAPGGRSSHGLPEFAVVTGVSTGAILSTFAFTNRTELAVRGYSIEKEGDLLRPIATIRNGQPTPASYIRLLRRGALADLAPLRTRLTPILTDEIMLAVAAGADRGRLLVVGVVDNDTGQAVALDLTDMAQRFRKASAEAAAAGKEAARACYVEAVVASSSAPMAALPVFIDNREYVDGGERFGMFSDELGEVMDRTQVERAALGPAGPTIYLIANGVQKVGPMCGRTDPKLCPGGYDPPDDLTHPHRKWKFTELALRSEAILTDQVYRFSADSVEVQARRRNFRLQAAKIDDDMPDHQFAMNDPALGQGTQTCTAWHDEDQRLLDPIQFFPRYMHCLIDYGRTRAGADHAAGRLQ